MGELVVTTNSDRVVEELDKSFWVVSVLEEEDERQDERKRYYVLGENSQREMRRKIQMIYEDLGITCP